MGAHDILRKLQALGTRIECADGRLVLRAGSQPVPRLLVEQARDAKRELLALLHERAGLRPPREGGVSLTTNHPVAALAKNLSENRRNSGGLLRPPPCGLSGGLSRDPDGVAALADGLIADKSEDFCGSCEDSRDFNWRVSEGFASDPPKAATLNPTLAVLAIDEDFCGAQQVPPPKAATLFCGEGLSHAAAQQNTAGAERRETGGCETGGYASMCCECGAPIIEPVVAWWGGQPCHRDCGEAAWRRELRSALATFRISPRGA